ncbi:hypothetical protein LWI29_018103 [Acer saccharum]|uniref:Uncharacterized protein n=1 Tax=Acer saccharum TaxID=4024 RepID=A0AA39T4P8_ACESA|nr:hypothetical protein LWI29_018103 [Acer saccharum]
MGQNLVTGMEWLLSSWKSIDDPAPGDFTFQVDPHGFPQLFVKKGPKILYRAGSWNGLRWTGTPYLVTNSVYTYEFVSNETGLFYTFDIRNISVPERWVMSSSGYLLPSKWKDQNWERFSVTEVDRCELYDVCGSYASCNINNLPDLCECLGGFTPKSPGHGTEGCVRRAPLHCNQSDGFLIHKEVKLPDTSHSRVDNNISLAECKEFCLNNCSCTAYANSDVREGRIGCLLWFGDLFDIKKLELNGQDLYVRVAASELANIDQPIARRRHLSEKKRAIILVSCVVSAVGVLVLGWERGETSNSDIHRRRHCEVFNGTGDNFDDADDIRDDFDGSCTTPATPPTVPFNHASNSSLQSRFEMYADPEITPTDQETAQWYYDGLQNVDDLYPALGSLDNMPDEYEDGRSTTPPQSRPTNAAGPSGAATPTPTTGGPPGVCTQRHESVIQSFQELRNEFKDFESRVQDSLEIVLDEHRDSNQRREEEHAELMRIFRSYRHNDDQSHTPLGHSLSMSQYARSYHPFDPPMGLQNSAEVQDPPVGIQNSPNVQDPPLMAQQTSKVQDPPVNCRLVRLRKRGWQQTTPYTDPCKPKRAKSASHKFKPDEKVDAEVLANYVAFKEEPNGRRDEDIQLIVDVPWFVQFESNNSILEDTTNMVKWWEEMMPARTTDKPSEEWPVLSYKWTAEQIAWARGKNVGCYRPWNEVDTLLIPVNVGGGHWLMAKVGLTLRSIRLYDPVGQPVEYQVRNQQLACLRWFLPSMLNQICFYKKKRKGTNMNPDPFHMELVPPHNFSQQQTGGNCGALTLALIEHTVAKRKKLNWTDEQMPHMD